MRLLVEALAPYATLPPDICDLSSDWLADIIAFRALQVKQTANLTSPSHE